MDVATVITTTTSMAFATIIYAALVAIDHVWVLQKCFVDKLDNTLHDIVVVILDLQWGWHIHYRM